MYMYILYMHTIKRCGAEYVQPVFDDQLLKILESERTTCTCTYYGNKLL